MNWVIKCSYPQGSHVVMHDGERLRFSDKQEAVNRAEILSAMTRDAASRNMRANNVTYIVVEESI